MERERQAQERDGQLLIQWISHIAGRSAGAAYT